MCAKDALSSSPSLGMPSTFGCYALLNSKPYKNSAVVDKVDLAVFGQLSNADRLELIADGLIIVGKSNLNVRASFFIQIRQIVDASLIGVFHVEVSLLAFMMLFAA
jgi:hypothetical protein